MRSSDYAELRAFAAVARHGSFARAARFLGVTPSALSQTVRGLEERLGQRLFNRTTRSLSPTPSGARLADRILPLIDSLEAAVSEAMADEDEPSGPLRLNAARVAVPVLSAVLPGFLAAFPRVTLEIETSDSLVDIVRAGFDAGIRLGERLEEDMVALRFGGDLRMAVVGAPGYFERHPPPLHPRDLALHRCLVLRSPTDGSLYRWEFARGGQEIQMAVEGPLLCNDPALRLAAALAGTGLGYFFEHQVAARIAEGSLIRVLEDWTPAFAGCFLYYPGRRQMRPALRAFIDHARQTLVAA